MTLYRPLNPSARKKASRLYEDLAVAAGTTYGASKDARGVEGASFRVIAANLTGTVDVTIEGRYKTTDPWFTVGALAQLAADGDSVWPAIADAEGVTLPRYVRAEVIVGTGPADVTVLMEHALPKEGRQVNHHSRS